MKPEKKRLLIITLIIILLSLGYYLSYYKYLEVDVDEGLLIHGADRVLDGQLPLKDFHQYMPGRYYLLGLWFLIFGKSIAAARILLLVAHTLKNVLIFHVARRVVPLPFSLVPVALMLLMPGFWVKTDVSVVLLLNMLLLLRYLTAPHRLRRLFFMGLAAGFSALFREDMAGYVCLTVGMMLLVKGLLDGERFWPIVRRGLIFSLGVLAVMGSVLLVYVTQGGLGRFIEGIAETVKLGHIESSPLPPPAVIRLKPSLLFVYLAMLLFAIMAAMLIVRFRKNEPGERTANLHLLALAILSVLSFYHIWHWTHEFRIIQTGSLIHVLWAFVMFKAFSAARRWMRLRAPLPAAALGLAGTAVLALQVHLVVFSFTTNTISPFDVGAISMRTGVHHPIEGTDRSGILPPIHTATAHSHILKYIGDNTAPDDTLYCFGESILYFLSGRKNATEFDNGRIPAYFPGQREKFVRQLWGRKPRLIIVRDFEWSWWSSKMPEIFEAIQRDYYLEGDLFNFYVFSRVSDLDADIRRANRHFWKGEVTEAAAAYWASLQKNRDHPEVKKILSRFFFSRDLAERSLPVLESYAFRKDGDAWRLRWGTRGRRRFTGRIFGAGAEGGAKLFSGVNVFPRDDGSLRWSVGPGGVLSFVSDLREGAAGLDITVSDPSLMSSFRFELFVDGEPAALVFLFWRGLIPSGEVAINAPSL